MPAKVTRSSIPASRAIERKAGSRSPSPIRVRRIPGSSFAARAKAQKSVLEALLLDESPDHHHIRRPRVTGAGLKAIDIDAEPVNPELAGGHPLGNQELHQLGRGAEPQGHVPENPGAEQGIAQVFGKPATGAGQNGHVVAVKGHDQREPVSLGRTAGRTPHRARSGRAPGQSCAGGTGGRTRPSGESPDRVVRPHSPAARGIARATSALHRRPPPGSAGDAESLRRRRSVSREGTGC